MKDFIKETLRESIEKNALGVSVTRPNQKLIIMRGIPGSGKSTKAKSLVDKGKIHSTDDLITSNGDYREFFAKMIASGDFSPLSKMHSKNLNDAIASMKAGISPVIIDNTNIKQNEPKAYVVAALEMGYADNNIEFVDIGTAGLEAQALANRNAHGVPLDKIKQMIASHTAQGPMTLKSVLGAKDMYKQSDILYSAIVLDESSKHKLLEIIGSKIPKDWKIFAHHMTIKLGELKNKDIIGRKANMLISDWGISDMVIAVKVKSFPAWIDKIKNETPHITVAINPNGGKPAMSNELKVWQPLKEFVLDGIVTEISKYQKK